MLALYLSVGCAAFVARAAGPRFDSGHLNPRGTRGCPEQNRRGRGHCLSFQYGIKSAILRRIMEFTHRCLSAGRDHFFFLGPRGTGKTLWCNHEFPDVLRIDLLDPATLRQFSAQPERLRELVEANPSRKQVFVDDIQKLPELLDVVHLLIEKKTGQQFVLTGSSARKLRRVSTAKST